MQKEPAPDSNMLMEENQKLKAQLEELQETFRAIRYDEVDALIIKTTKGDRVFTLKGADQSYRVLIEQMKEGAALLSNDNKTILYSNSSLANLLNQPLNKLICGDIQDHIAPTHQKAFMALLAECKKGSNRISKEITLQKSDGTLVPTIMSLNSFPVDNTEATYTVVTDLTEHMEEYVKQYTARLEKEIKEKSAALKDAERMAAIGQTAGMVGHDIRNPLQTITGELFLAKDELKQIQDCPSKPQLKEMLDNIEQQVDYINKIVTDLQDFSKPVKPDLKRTNLEKLIKETLQTITMPKAISTRVKIEKSLPDLLIDPSMTQRVMTNLIINAVQAIPKEGEIRIEATKQNRDVLITVRDTGVGIPEEIQPNIFQPLFSTKAKGQGFGLAVVKRFIEAQNGHITFESEKGKGTAFIIRLPLSSSQAFLQQA